MEILNGKNPLADHLRIGEAMLQKQMMEEQLLEGGQVQLMVM